MQKDNLHTLYIIQRNENEKTDLRCAETGGPRISHLKPLVPRKKACLGKFPKPVSFLGAPLCQRVVWCNVNVVPSVQDRPAWSQAGLIQRGHETVSHTRQQSSRYADTAKITWLSKTYFEAVEYRIDEYKHAPKPKSTDAVRALHALAMQLCEAVVAASLTLQKTIVGSRLLIPRT